MKKLLTILLLISLAYGYYLWSNKTGSNNKKEEIQNRRNNEEQTETVTKPQRDVYLIKRASSTVNWQIGEILGQIPITGGSIITRDNNPVDGVLTLDLQNISSNNNEMIMKLQNSNYLDTANNPKATFIVTKIEPINSTNDYSKMTDIKILGNLTIKNITKGITFPGKIKIMAGGAQLESSFSLNLDEWISTSNDTIKLNITLEATK